MIKPHIQKARDCPEDGWYCSASSDYSDLCSSDTPRDAYQKWKHNERIRLGYIKSINGIIYSNPREEFGYSTKNEPSIEEMTAQLENLRGDSAKRIQQKPTKVIAFGHLMQDSIRVLKKAIHGST